mmetsp:Transcript_6440/g.8717  ORF Transcript_6440/g.8717 Transcript_6440/m.8717 type:complete len:257 (-) Transcript_6440:77-847(-)
MGVIPSRDFLDLAVLNMYFVSGSGLGVHKDSQALFERPVVSLRLFGSNVLSFGCQGVGQTHRLHAIPQPRGCITVMEGYAADMLKHSIRPKDSMGKSASLMFRKLTEVARTTMIVHPVLNVNLGSNENPTLCDDANFLSVKLHPTGDKVEVEIATNPFSNKISLKLTDEQSVHDLQDMCENRMLNKIESSLQQPMFESQILESDTLASSKTGEESTLEDCEDEAVLVYASASLPSMDKSLENCCPSIQHMIMQENC